MRVLLALVLSLLPLPALAEPPQSLGDRLDMTSFPNSVGPRREEGLKTLADYGFVATGDDGTTYEEDDGSWRFVVTPLASGDGRMLVCVEDQALNGGSYHTRHALELVEDASGLLRATAGPVTHPDCAERQ